MRPSNIVHVLVILAIAAVTRHAPLPTPRPLSATATQLPQLRMARAALSSTQVLYPVIEDVAGSAELMWVVFERGEYLFGERNDLWTTRGPRIRTRAAPALSHPHTFTLVGSGPPCVVTTSDTMYLAQAGNRHRVFEVDRVFEVARSMCDGDYVIAVPGVDEDARAHPPAKYAPDRATMFKNILQLSFETLAFGNSRARIQYDALLLLISTQWLSAAASSTTAWVERTLGVRLPDNGLYGPMADLQSLPGSDVEVIVAFLPVQTSRKSQFELLLRRNGRLVKRLPDVVFKGHLFWGGQHYVIVDGQAPPSWPSTRAHTAHAVGS